MLEGAGLGAIAGGVARYGVEVGSAYYGDVAFDGSTCVACVFGGMIGGMIVAPVLNNQGYREGYGDGYDEGYTMGKRVMHPSNSCE